MNAALLANAGMSAVAIQVATKENAVTLSGTVDSSAAKNRAKQIATSVPNVRSVTDQLKVRS